MIVILYEDSKESITADMTAEWLAENNIPVAGFFIDVNETAAELATDHNITVFPAIISIGNFDTDATELFVNYAEGLDAIKALSAETIEEIRADVIPVPNE